MKCQRCGGRLTLNQDRNGRFAECMMCGAEVQLDNDGRPLTVEDRAPGREAFAATKLWRQSKRGRR